MKFILLGEERCYLPIYSSRLCPWCRHSVKVDRYNIMLWYLIGVGESVRDARSRDESKTREQDKREKR
jgi:hypothetical protein